MNSNENFQILLYYKYVHIEDPESFTEEHLQYCKDLGLKGRVLIAEEGINGTVSGTIEQTEQYMKDMHADSRFSDLVFKVDEHDQHTFKKMHVRHRPELVTLRLEDDVVPLQTTGDYLSTYELYDAMKDEIIDILDE